ELLDVGTDATEVVDEGLDVAAGAERFARAGDDDGTYCRVLVGFEHGVEQLATKRHVERVERVGAAQREGGDAVGARQRKRLVGHAKLLRQPAWPRRVAAKATASSTDSMLSGLASTRSTP